MQNPFVKGLRDRLQAASNPVTAAEIQAEIALYCARSGDFEQAENICQQLRKSFGDGRFPRVSVLIMCVEGLIGFFRDFNMGALDRLVRANLLSRSMKIDDVAAYSSAWMAHIYFNMDSYDLMCQSVRQCLEKLTPNDWGARGRVTIVLSDAFLVTGDRAESNRYFSLAREAAVRLGDHTLNASLTYNRAALNAYLTQIAILSGDVEPSAIESVNAEINSAFNYHQLAQLSSLEQFLHLARIGVLLFQADFRSALNLADDVLKKYGPILSSGQLSMLNAQRVLCAVHAGDEVVGGGGGSAFQPEFSDKMEGCDNGDKAIIFYCYSRAANAMGDQALAERYMEAMRDSIARHTSEKTELFRKIDDFKGALA